MSYPTMKPSCVMLSFFLLLLVVASKNANSAEIIEYVNFNFESFTNGNPLIELQGNATVLADGNVLLFDPTKSGKLVGRVLYAPTVRLWDTVSGRAASFITSFSFQLRNYQNLVPADGIVFFIAPENTQIPLSGAGGGFGVADLDGVGEFVGVEFDNHFNPEYNDPPRYSHIGIDANSVFSLKTVEWNSVSGSMVTATVIYDSSSNILSVALRNRDIEIITISQVVDLKEKLPPRVKFGFSAAGRQYHVIRSWSFASSLKIQTAADVATA